MDFQEPLNQILATRSAIRILRTLFPLPPGLRLSGRDIARRARVSAPAAISTLEEFRRQGLVRVRRVPKRAEYEVNRQHVLFEPLRRLFEFEEHINEDLRSFLHDQLTKRLPDAQVAILYGSGARREIGSTSDIDLFVLHPADEEELEESLSSLEEDFRERFGNPLSIVVEGLSPAQFARRARSSGPSFWRRVIESGEVVFGELA